MSRKQVILRIIIILIISLILAIVFFFGLKSYQGHKNIELMDSYIKEHHLQDKIKKQDNLYSAKKGCITKKSFSKMNLMSLMLCNQLVRIKVYL